MFNTYIEIYDLMEQLQKQSDLCVQQTYFFNKTKKRKQAHRINRKFFIFSIRKYLRRYCYRSRIKRVCRKINKIFFYTSILKLLKEIER